MSTGKSSAKRGTFQLLDWVAEIESTVVDFTVIAETIVLTGIEIACACRPGRV
jgi:hypothetical protein